jgi:ribosomal protein S18 acetylase RimI-like enzyme
MNIKSQVQLLQEISANAWPAKQISLVNGWLVRLSEGVTRRANSVLPLVYYGTNLTSDIKLVENLYYKYNLPVIFQLPDYFEPKNLLSSLKDAGYSEEAETIVMSGSLKNMKAITQNQDFVYKNTNDSFEEWVHALQQFVNRSDEYIANYKKIVNRIAQAKEYFFAYANKKIVGIAMAVIERAHLGIYSMITHPDFRRQGIAKSIIKEMVRWGKDVGIKTIYLQVQGDNTGAIALYKSVYLDERYRYRYLVKKQKEG